MSGNEIFGYGWREDHARKGDAALAATEAAIVDAAKVSPMVTEEMQARMANIQAYAAIAQAHYAAANIRTRPIRDAELP